MKTVIESVRKVVGTTDSPLITASTDCNYANNYYGDQVCVPCGKK